MRTNSNTFKRVYKGTEYKLKLKIVKLNDDLCVSECFIQMWYQRTVQAHPIEYWDPLTNTYYSSYLDVPLNIRKRTKTQQNPNKYYDSWEYAMIFSERYQGEEVQKAAELVRKFRKGPMIDIAMEAVL